MPEPVAPTVLSHGPGGDYASGHAGEIDPVGLGRDAVSGRGRVGPRSDQKRGPQAAVGKPKRDVLGEQARRASAPFGGFPVEAAERHLINYHSQFEEGTDNDIFFRTTRAIVVAARRWRKVANDRVKAVGQTMARWETLFLVAFSGEELTQGELARLISIEGPTMVRMLDTLAQDGLIERRQSEVDRRVTTNRITPKGHRVIREVMAITNTLRADLLRDIDPERLAITIDTLGLILTRLDEMRDG
jgi:MarR family transcriptional regulator for hemolysin